jgi:acetyltransferase-like isoleucine patch superfamily enzyme
MQKHIRENGNVIYGDLENQTNFNCKFFGFNNIVYIVNKTDKVSIEFRGSNSLVFIGDNFKSVDGINIISYTDNLVYIGDNNSFGITTLWASETKNIIIGNNCMFSWHLFFRTSDQHLILNSNNNDRINYPKSIYIGDHVWGGINTQYNKGTKIFSGCVLGMNSIATRDYFSNSINVGIPAKQIKENIFWNDTWTDNFNKENIRKHSNIPNDNFKYTYNQNEFLSPKAIEEKLDSLNTAQEKLEFVYNAIYCNKNKNRFAYFKDMPYDIPLPKYENKFKSLKFEEIDETKPQSTPPAPKPTPQPTPQELEIKVLKEQLAQKEQEIKNLQIDYQKAIKVTNHLSYKLGQALIKANKNWYKGGYVKFIFEVMGINKEHKK